MDSEDYGIFNHMETFLLFLGNGNSGSSLQGNLINAHPDAVVSQEAMAVRRLKENGKMNRRQMLNFIWARSRNHAKKDNEWYKYSYNVPGWWQGRARRLKVVGDKRASETTYYLAVYDGLFDKMRQMAGVPIKFIHCVRNPFDNITTIMVKNREYHGTDLSLEDAMDKYFTIEMMAHDLKGLLRPDESIYMTKLEDLIQNPAGWLRETCAFLGLDAPDDYVEACADIVFKTPKRTRQDIQWPRKLIDRVYEEKAKFAHLQDYEY